MHKGWYFCGSAKETLLRETQHQEEKKIRSVEAASNEKKSFLR
jgi:hypothetical protein